MTNAMGRWVESNNTTQSQIYQAVYAPDGREAAVMSSQSVISVYVDLPKGAKAIYLSGGISNYWHPDWLGTARLVTSTTRTKVFDEDLGPFGEVRHGPIADNFFTGVAQVHEANDLRTFPARNLGTGQSRWLSPDPAGVAAVNITNPQSFNRYAYVLGNPLGLVHPTGLDPERIYTPPIEITAQDPGPIGTVSSYDAPGSRCSDRCLDQAEAASYNSPPFLYDLSYRKKIVLSLAAAPNNPPQVPHTCQQNRILNAVSGSTLTNPNDTIGTSVGGHSQFGINVTTDQLAAAGFTPFNPFGHADVYHNGNVFFQVHDNGAGGIVTQGHIDVFNPATGLFGFLGHSIVDVGIGTLLQHLFPHSHGLLDPGC